MSVPTLLVIIAAVLACIDIFEARGRSLVGWAVLAISVALLWGPRISL